MKTGEYLYTILGADVALATLLGSPPRIAHGVAAPGTPGPWVAYQKVSGESQNSHSGTDAMGRNRYQFTVYGLDVDVVEQIGDDIERVLNCQDQTVNGERITIFKVDDDDGYESDTALHFRRLDFEVWRSTTSQ